MTARRTRLRPRPPRAGMSLIEIMIAMVMLGIVLVTIAKLSLSVAYAGRTNDLVSTRTAVLQQQAARLGAIPYTTLQAMSTSSSTITVGGTAYSRTITLTPSAKYTTVKIVLSPTSSATARDSLVFTRANPSGGSPLCTGC
ncbi:MAG TPA: prepilin-type N-terminal cleavage/methylation domain-containing protein [Gemmatimonadaceae bacterium]|nr:prepilin-type N-terminal cleavage/methylation domain-containing protein [Gemmatimonadaceae bacterium]